MMSIKKILNTKNKKMDKIDFIILSVIIAFYSVLSFINLGTTSSPWTFLTLNKEEEITLKLKDKEKVENIKFFNGNLSGTYKITSSTNNIDYNYIATYKGNGAFSWNDEKLKANAKYLKIKSLQKSTLGSVTLYDNNLNKIAIDKVISKNKNKNNLIDEQRKTPKKINYLNSSYFDEIYFARTAYEYANGLKAYDWVHPPLGKLIQAIPIKIFNNMSPFFYRLVSNICGILMIVIMYLFCKQMFLQRKFSILGALLMTFDTFHFVQTRIGTIDSILVLFILLSYFFMYKYISESNEKYLMFSGLFFGCATSVKWIGLFAGLGLAIIFFTHVIKNKLISIKLLLKCCMFYILIPLVIYIGSYLLFPNVENTYTNSIENIVIQTKDMYKYHSTLNAKHPFSSKWYTWIVTYKPVWYYQGEVSNNSHGTIVALGNIAIYWLGLITLLYTIGKMIIKKDKNSFFIVVGALSLYLPYIFIGRCMFLYHFFPVLPFVMLSIVNLFNDLCKKIKNNIFMYVYIAIVILVFIIYYPAISGIKVSNSYLDSIKLFDTWIF